MDYFAGANTRDGFFSLFDECFSQVTRKYLLKGSSGCGKSTLMKRVAEKAEALSMEVDRIYCSADVGSLDGVIIKSLGVAVIDATAPHIMDVRYPCVRESIVNLGEYWDRHAISSQSDEIIEHTDRKSEHYRAAYGRLAVAGSVHDLYRGCVARVTDRDALEKEAFSLYKRTAAGANFGRITRIFTSAFSSDGIKTLSSFGEIPMHYRIIGHAREALISTFIGILRERGIEAVISLSPTDPRNADAVFIPSVATLITASEATPASGFGREIRISDSKLLKSEASGARLRIRTLERLYRDILSEATAELALAKAEHEALEQIYIPCMDFSRLDARTGELITEIFEE